MKVRIGEGSGVVLLVFLWLLVGLVLALHLSYGVWVLYVLVSFAIALALSPAIREMNIAALASREAKALEEKHYSLGRFSIIILRGPVKITALRVVILFGVMGAGLAVLLLSMALSRPDPNTTSVTPISIGVLVVMVAINFLELRWRKADAAKSDPPNTPQ